MTAPLPGPPSSPITKPPAAAAWDAASAPHPAPKCPSPSLSAHPTNPSPASAQIQLKWPNDLVIDGRKLCGILAEAVSLGDQPAVVIGLGLNTSLTKEELPVPHATSLHLEGIPYERNELAVRVLNALHHRLTQWETNDPALMPDYRAVSATIGQNVRVILPNDTELLGTAEGVADDGRLQVRDQTGTLHELTAGDVTHLRLQ